MLFTQAQVSKVFNHVPPSTLKYWWARGLFDCAATKEARVRLMKKFGLINLYQIGLVSALMVWGIPVTVVREISMALDPNKMAGGLIVSRDWSPREERPLYKWMYYDPEHELVFDDLYPTQLFVYLGMIKERVDALIELKNQQPQ